MRLTPGVAFIPVLVFSILSFSWSETAAQSCVEPPMGMLSWWPADNVAYDVMDSNHGGFLPGASYDAGVVGQAFNFNGASHVDVGGSTTLAPQNLTVQFWMFARAVRPDFTHPMARWGHASNVQSSWIFDYRPTGQMTFSVRNTAQQNGTATSTSIIPLNQWHHFAATFDGSFIKLYVDGELESQVAFNGPMQANASNTSIGAKKSDGVARFFLNGLVDEAQVYNRVLTAEEIEAGFAAGSAGHCKRLQTCPSNIVTWWPGGGSGFDVVDSNHGTLVNGVGFAAGKVGAAFNFDGANDFVRDGTNATMAPANITVSYWVFARAIRPDHTAVINRWGISGTAQNSWTFDLQPNQQMYFSLQNTSGQQVTLGSLATVPLNQWRHIVGTYDGSAVKVYIDGQLTNQTPFTGALNVAPSATSFGAKAQGNSFTFPFNGMVDEPMVLNRALTSTEVAEIHAANNAGLAICRATPNTPPTLTNVPSSASIQEQVPYSFDAEATDPDQDQTLMFSLIGEPVGAAIDPSSGVFTWTPSDQQGPASYSFTVRVSDGVANRDAAITINVGEVNEAPVLAAIGDQNVDESNTLAFTASAADPDHPPNALTFSLDPGAPDGAAIDASSGAFSWTPDETQGPGSYPVTVRVTDNGEPAASDFETITITVNEVNAAPVLAAIGDQSVAEGSALTFTASATDADHPPNALTYSLDSGAPAGATIDGSSGAFSWTPDEIQGPSSYPVTVRVTDNGDPAASDFETITIAVSEVNAAPVLAAIGDQSIAEGSALTFTASATDADHPPNALTYSLDSGAPAGAAIEASSGAFSWTPSEEQGPGSYPVTVRVTDNGDPAASDFETITIAVSEVNAAPVLAAIGDQSVAEGSALTFTASATDADHPPNALTYSLEVGAPAGATIDPTSGAFSWTPTEEQGPASYPVTVRVTDDGNPAASDHETITITVGEANQPPVLAAIGDKSIAEGSALTFTASATDGDQPPNNLAFSLDSGAPAGAAIDASSGAFSWTPTEAQGPGSYPVTVRVTDDGTPPANDSETITVTVTEVNQPPVLTVPGPQTVMQGQTLTFSTSATDPDLPANTLTFSLVTPPTPPGAAIDAASGEVTWTPPTAGEFVIRVQVSDGNGGSDTKDVPVTVNSSTITVTITGPPSGALYPIGTPVTFTGTFSGDGPGRTHSAQWTYDTITQSGTVNETNGTVTATYTFTAPGVYMVTLTVTNDLGVSGSSNQVNGMDAMVVIYDPNGGHITGGGWIISPPGSYPAAPLLSGKTNFGFVSKYHKNEPVPKGETQFHFKDGDLKFQSTAYEWMVITGSRAQNKGTGTINGSGNYSFLMTVTDGQRIGGGGVDRIRMKIWNTSTGAIAYDNQPGAPDNAAPVTALGGGSIVIHSTTGGQGVELEPVAVQSFALPPNAPNPFRGGTALRFELPRESQVRVVIYDVSGRVVATPVEGVLPAGRHARTWNGRDDRGRTAVGGIFFMRMEASADGQRFTATRRLVRLD